MSSPPGGPSRPAATVIPRRKWFNPTLEPLYIVRNSGILRLLINADTSTMSGVALPPDPADGTPRYTVAAVARRLGIAPATLRTWDRRYGMGPTDHQAGTRRRYSHADVARLELMRRLTVDGVAPAEAARLAQAASTERTASTPPAPDHDRSDGSPDEATLEPVRSGGRVLSLPGAPPSARGLARAAMALDASAVSRIVRRALDTDGVVATWEALLRPVLVAAGRRWEATGEGVDVEHLLSECVTGALRQTVQRVREPPGSRPALLTCSENEQHSLPLYALAAALAELGVPSRTLGAALPAAALHSAVARTGPSALFVWSHSAATACTGPLEALPVTRPPTRLIVGGPGWLGVPLPSRITYAESLWRAVELVRGVLAA
jgi:DNA-binding transcriptional MerR regulator